ncbi:MAG: hypothetical protein GY873_19720 [Bosea sp.]|nr:hypothetical protein [Bosea sp. (in: a-proteobacteria)]MCP4736415.1 hypothetical protein [Bosea sp. (in: a-proteobacteria)]
MIASRSSVKRALRRSSEFDRAKVAIEERMAGETIRIALSVVRFQT